MLQFKINGQGMRISTRLALGMILVLAPAASSIAADPSWLCIIDKITGFSVKNGIWSITTFRSGDKYLLIKNEEGQYEWRGFGKKIGSPCRENNTGLYCDSVEQVHFNKKTLRFLYVYPEGYVSGVDINENTPGIGIGTCSPL